MTLSRLSKGALDQLAHGLASGALSLESPNTLPAGLAVGEGVLVGDTLRRLHSLGLTSAQASAVLRLVLEERGASDRNRIDSVWSGPEGATAQTRDTSVVVRELFETATSRVLVSSYVLYQIGQLFEPLVRKMDSNPGLAVRLFVTVRRESGDYRPADEILEAFRGRLRLDWPGSRLPELFHDPRSLSMGGATRAVLHAKCVVIDGRRSFVTSANFTEAAQERNFELGLLVEDEPLARSIESQFEDLIQRGLVRPLFPG